MAFKALVFGVDEIYPSLKPFYDKEIERGNLEIAAHAVLENGKINLTDIAGKPLEGNLLDFDLAIISSKRFFYERMKVLERAGFPRSKIVDGTVFAVPNLDFPLFMKEGVAHGFLERTAFKLGTQTIHPQVYKIQGRTGSISLGMRSYINSGAEFLGDGEVSIQKFCPIARKTTFDLGENYDHNYKNVSSAPTWYFGWKTRKKFMAPQGTCKIMIGNDVWIGWGCILKSTNPGNPLVIGDGAVIASNSVVVKSVPPYAIVGGNPAQIIKYRFPPYIIEALLRIKWWDWNLDKIYDSFKYFNDVEKFIFLNDPLINDKLRNWDGNNPRDEFDYFDDTENFTSLSEI